MISLKSLIAPFRDQVSDENGIMNLNWQTFLRDLISRLVSLGYEKSYELENNVSNQLLSGFVYDSDKIKGVLVDYFIQRKTSTTDQVELGILRICKSVSGNWQISKMFTAAPDDCGVTFSITTDGKVRYTSTNNTSPQSFFKLSIRDRVMSGVNLV